MMPPAEQHAYSTYILRPAAGPGAEDIKAYSYYPTYDRDWKVSAGHAKPPNYLPSKRTRLDVNRSAITYGPMPSFYRRHSALALLLLAIFVSPAVAEKKDPAF